MGVAMKRFDLVTRGNSLAFSEYVVKCLVGVSIGYLLMKTFPRESGQYYWLLISVVLSITHDNNSKVALDRMRGNVIGSLVGFAVFLLHQPPNLLTICIGVAITVTVCFALDLISVCRTALVGFIIVIMYEGEHGSWTGAVYRMLGVVLGCTLGLIINYTFSKLTSPMFQRLAAEAGPEDAGSE